MRKKLISVSLSLFILFSFSFSLGEVAALTNTQIQAIISLVRSFGGDETVLKKVEDSLYGRASTEPAKMPEQSFCYTWSRNLRIGDKGADVDALRNALARNGVLDNFSHEKTLGKSFDKTLTSAVVTFQEKYASEVLTPSKLRRGTGIVGASTRAKLNSLYGRCMVGEPSIQTRDARRISDAKQLQLALELYYDANGSYPPTLLELTPKFIYAIPSEPLSGGAYFYKALPDSCRANCSNYHLGVDLEDRKSPALASDADANTATDKNGINGNDGSSCFSRASNRFCLDLSAKSIASATPHSTARQNPSGGEIRTGGTPNPNAPRPPPMIDGIFGPTALEVGATGTWTVKAHDPKNGQLVYAVYWGDTGALSAPTAFAPQTATFTHRYERAGYYRVTFTATDNTRLIAELKLTVQVGNDPTQSNDSNRGGTTRRSGGYLAPTLTVLSPNGGESWAIGTTQTIRWTTNQIVSSIVSVQLLKDNGAVYRWDPPFTDNTLSWSIASTSVFGALVPGSDYKIRVNVDTSPNNIVGDDIIRDDSSSSFTITMASPMTDAEIITALEEGVRAHGCTSSNIGNCDSHFDLTGDGAVNGLDEAKMRLVRDQTYSEFDKIYMKIIAAVDARMGLKTGVANYETNFDANRNDEIDSDDKSRISRAMIGTRVYPPPAQPQITVISPNGGETWKRDTIQVITWSSTVMPPDASVIKVISEADRSKIYTVGEGSSSDGYQSWQVGRAPNNVTIPDGEYRVSFCIKATNVCDESNSSFTITSGTAQPSYTLEPGKVYFFKLPGYAQLLDDLDSYIKDGQGFLKGNLISADLIQSPIYSNGSIGYASYYYRNAGPIGGIGDGMGWRSVVAGPLMSATSTPNNYIIISTKIAGGRTMEWVPPLGTVYYGDNSATGNPNGVRWLNDFKHDYPATPTYTLEPGKAYFFKLPGSTQTLADLDAYVKDGTGFVKGGSASADQIQVPFPAPNLIGGYTTLIYYYRSVNLLLGPNDYGWRSTASVLTPATATPNQYILIKKLATGGRTTEWTPPAGTVYYGDNNDTGNPNGVRWLEDFKKEYLIAPTYTLEPGKIYYFKLPRVYTFDDLGLYRPDGTGFVKGAPTLADQIQSPFYINNGISLATYYYRRLGTVDYGWRSFVTPNIPATTTPNQYIIIDRRYVSGQPIQWLPPTGTVYYGDNSATGNPNGLRWIEDFKKDYPAPVTDTFSTVTLSPNTDHYFHVVGGMFTLSNLSAAGFLNSSSHLSRTDEMYTFQSNPPAALDSPSTTYYRLGGEWYRVGGGLVPLSDSSEIGQYFIIRKRTNQAVTSTLAIPTRVSFDGTTTINGQPRPWDTPPTMSTPTYTLEPGKAYFFKLPGGAQLLADLDAYVKDGQGFVKGSDASSADQILDPQNGTTISYATYFNKNTSFLGGTGWRNTSDLFTPVTSTPNNYLIINKGGTANRVIEWMPPAGTVYYGDNSAIGNPNGLRWIEDFKRDYPWPVSNSISPSSRFSLLANVLQALRNLFDNK